MDGSTKIATESSMYKKSDARIDLVSLFYFECNSRGIYIINAVLEGDFSTC